MNSLKRKQNFSPPATQAIKLLINKYQMSDEAAKRLLIDCGPGLLILLNMVKK